VLALESSEEGGPAAALLKRLLGFKLQIKCGLRALLAIVIFSKPCEFKVLTDTTSSAAGMNSCSLKSIAGAGILAIYVRDDMDSKLHHQYTLPVKCTHHLTIA